MGTRDIEIQDLMKQEWTQLYVWNIEIDHDYGL